MTLGRTPAGAIKIKKDGGLRAVECACCQPCPEITESYIVISEAMYNALRSGGSVSASGGGSEYTGCSFSGTGGGTLSACGGDSTAFGGVTCTSAGQEYGSFISFAWQIAKVGSEYRLGYGGGGAFGIYSGSCFSNIYPTFCYTVGFFTSWNFDNNGGDGFVYNVGTTTLTTSAGSLTFGIWNLDPSATAYLNINIT
jgi:hypothetical protein